MGKVLLPRNFLRVADKFFPGFALGDAELSSGSLLLYLIFFYLVHNQGECSASQKDLAKFCRCSVRTIQTHLSKLEALGYIDSQGETGTAKTYVLTQSDRVDALIHSQRVALQPALAAPVAPTQNLPTPCEDSAQVFNIDVLKNIKKLNSPLSPLPESITQNQAALSPVGSGSGGSYLAPSGKARTVGAGLTLPVPASADTDFELLWAVWPVRKDKHTASNIFNSMKRQGKIPPITDLLACIEHFKNHDSHWKNGYAPKLSNWLKGQGWNDEVFIRSAHSVPQLQPDGQPCADPNMVRQVKEIEKRLAQGKRLFSVPLVPPQIELDFSEADAVSKALFKLWPGAHPEALKSYCRSLQQQGSLAPIDIVLKAAQAALLKKQNFSLFKWLGEFANACSKGFGQSGVFGSDAGSGGSATTGLFPKAHTQQTQQSWKTELQLQAVSPLLEIAFSKVSQLSQPIQTH